MSSCLIFVNSVPEQLKQRGNSGNTKYVQSRWGWRAGRGFSGRILVYWHTQTARQAGCDCRLLSGLPSQLCSDLQKNFSLYLTAASPCSLLWCVDQQQVPFPGFHSGQDNLAKQFQIMEFILGTNLEWGFLGCFVFVFFCCLFVFILPQLLFFWSKMAEYKLLMKSRAKGGLLSISWHMVCNHVCGNHVCNHGLYISLWCCLCALYIGMQYTQRGCFGQKSPPVALFKCV